MIIGIILLAVIACAAGQLLWLKYNGTPVPEPAIPREVQTRGSGKPLRYAVLGDSTSVSQGSAYKDGYAVASAAYLARTHTVSWMNAGVSGARAADVLRDQVPKAAMFAPDVVLIAVGANDVTHGTDAVRVRDDLRETISQLTKANKEVRIVLTGSPDMGSPPRIPQPLRWLAGKRTVALNAKITGLVDDKTVFLAPIAEQTGPAFRADPTLFASDNFHPNAAGYALWSPVVTAALQRAGL